MKCWLIYSFSSLKTHGYTLMEEAAAKVGIDCCLFFDNQLSVKFDQSGNCIILGQDGALELPDLVLMRCYNFPLSQALEMCGVRVVNTTFSMMQSFDKFLTHTLLSKNNVASIPTISPATSHSFLQICSELNCSKVVLKSHSGTKGEKVWLVGSESEYLAILDSISGPILAQKFIKESSGSDIRVWVVGGRAVGAVVRTNGADFRSNIAQGASSYHFELTPEVASLAISAAKAVGTEICGVDILQGGDGFMVCEVNGNCGFRSSINFELIPNAIFNYLKTLC